MNAGLVAEVTGSALEGHQAVASSPEPAGTSYPDVIGLKGVSKLVGGIAGQLVVRGL
jgi:hypothetical protein